MAPALLGEARAKRLHELVPATQRFYMLLLFFAQMAHGLDSQPFFGYFPGDLIEQFL